MRNFKKILIMICVLSLLAVGCVILALANEGEEENMGSVAELSELITTAEKATTATEKYDAMMAIREYLDTKVMDTAEEGYEESLLRINAASVEGADIFLDMIPADVEATGVNIEEVADTFMYADDLLRMFDIPDGTAGFSSVQSKYDSALFKLASALIKDLGTDIANEANPKTAENKIKLNKANRIITYCIPYGENAALATIQEEFAKCVEAHNQAVAKNLAALDDMNDVSSYELPIYYSEDWEGKNVGYGAGLLTAWSFTTNGTTNRVGIRQEKNGNKYYVHEYLEKENPAGSFIQRGLSGFNADKGLVFEFDIATFGEIPEKGILVETGSISGVHPGHYFAINGNGDIYNPQNQSEILLKGALTKGGWLHVIIALDPEDFVYKLYVEGQYLGQYSAALPDGNSFDHTKVALRLSGGASTQGEIAYDNFKIYAGDNYRNHDRLTNMTDEEKFIYYVNAFTNANNPVMDRKSAHDKATDAVRDFCTVNSDGTYTYNPEIEDNAELKAAIDKYMAFDIDTLVSDAKLDNLKSYVSLVEKLRAIERSLDETKMKTRNALVDEISTFVKKNLSLMDLSADLYTANYETSSEKDVPNGVSDYDEYVLIYNKLAKQVEYDETSSLFVKYMEKFSGATSLAATERYYNFAKELIDNDLIDVTLITVETTPYRENFPDLIAAYDIYINSDKKVAVVTKTNNSKRIVQCMNVINHFRTEEQWEANRDLMVEYLNIVKDVVLGTDAAGEPLYNTSYEGVDEAVRFFNRAYAYFYAKIQAESIEYIENILGLISATDDYVEKIGLVALIDRYVMTHDVDTENAEIAVLLDNLDTVKSELELRGEDYSKYLLQNSVYFINYVEKMRTANTYSEQVEYYEMAALLYFSLDTTVPGTVAAIDTFDEYSTKLEIIKESSVRFLEAVAIYRACETADDKYAALIDCYYNAQFAELSYDGVAEAMAEYQSAYDAYVSYANSVNADITVTGNAVGSFRTNCGITTIIAIIVKKIFGV